MLPLVRGTEDVRSLVQLSNSKSDTTQINKTFPIANIHDMFHL